MPDKYKVSLYSSRSLASADFAALIYEAFDTWAHPPDVFDRYEPIRQEWRDRSGFMQAWAEESPKSFGQVLIRRRKKPSYYAHAIFLLGGDLSFPGKPPYHGFSIYQLEERGGDVGVAKSLVSLVDDLFMRSDSDYGFICLDSEFDQKNIIKNYRHADGGVEPRKPVGMNWPKCIPGLYWMNYYGEEYLNRGFGGAALRPSTSGITQVGSGVRVQLYPNPADYDTDNAMDAALRMKTILGAEWFYSDEQTPCRPLDVSLDSLLLPRYRNA